VSDEADQQAPQRGPIEGQLRVGLVIIQTLAALMVVFAVVIVVVAFRGDDPSGRTRVLTVAFSFILLPAVVLFFTARSARARLFVHAKSAKLYCVLTGVFTVAASIPLLRGIAGVLLLVVGLFVLTAAVLYRWKEAA
jgi:hypothetical protein